ncbi:hypothetical protein [Gryllotalpicola koreensis]|uniref:LppP/LprE family lipoprotein n=1 Tax=Gryllotalpicola koreensis TaxID=993086 RepID=A0ABP8A4X9_9MICO
MQRATRGIVSLAAAAALLASVSASLVGCAGSEPRAQPTERATVRPTPTTGTEPKLSPVTGSATPVLVVPPGTPTMVPQPFVAPGGSPPKDDAAMARAKEWITQVGPPPSGVRVLDSAPPGAPTQPATSAACDWLVQATKWWSTYVSNINPVKQWAEEHPVDGLAFTESMNGPGDLTGMTARSAEHPSDSLQFEFAPLPDGTVAIRIDVVIVPKGASCARSGSASSGGSRG